MNPEQMDLFGPTAPEAPPVAPSEAIEPTPPHQSPAEWPPDHDPDRCWYCARTIASTGRPGRGTCPGAIPCPTCAAAAGRKCRRPSGHESYAGTMHEERYRTVERTDAARCPGLVPVETAAGTGCALCSGTAEDHAEAIEHDEHVAECESATCAECWGAYADADEAPEQHAEGCECAECLAHFADWLTRHGRPEARELVAQPTPTHAEAARLDAEDDTDEPEPLAPTEPADPCGAWLWAWAHRYACRLPYGHEEPHECTRHVEPCATCDTERDRPASNLLDLAEYEPPTRDADARHGWHAAITWKHPDPLAPAEAFSDPIVPDANGHGATVENRDTRTDGCDPREHPGCTGKRHHECPDDPRARYLHRGACPCGWRGAARESDTCAYLDAVRHAWPDLVPLEWPGKRPAHDATKKQLAAHAAKLAALVPAGYPTGASGAPIVEDRTNDSEHHATRAHHAHEYGGLVAVDRRTLAHYGPACPYCLDLCPCCGAAEHEPHRPYCARVIAAAEREQARQRYEARRSALREAIEDDPEDDGEGWCPVCEDDHEPPYCDELETADQ